MTFAEALGKWTEHCRPQWGERSYENVLYLARDWTKVLGPLKLEKVGLQEVAGLWNLRRPGRCASTLNDERGYLKRFFEFAILQGWTKVDPTVIWPKQKRIHNDEYAQELAKDEEAILWPALDEITRRVCTVCLYTGLRLSSALALRWEWINADWVVTVPARIMKARRAHSILLSPIVRKALGQPQEEGPVFPDAPSRNVISARFKRAVRATGVNPGLKVHDLRRSFATRLLDAGVPLTTVLQLGSWRSVPVLLTHYLARKEALKFQSVVMALDPTQMVS